MDRQAIVVADLGFGDAGKGGLVDFLTRSHQAATVVRYNGGPQAGHNVVTPEGRKHTFSSFGSGMFIPRVETHLTAEVLVNPLNMITEGAALGTKGVADAFARTTVHRDALIITPYHRAAGRLRELMRDELVYDRHGSCGEGVGEARFMELEGIHANLRAGHLLDRYEVEAALGLQQATYQTEFNFCRRSENEEIQEELATVDCTAPADVADVYLKFAEMVRIVDDDYLAGRLQIGTTVFEGAQGVLLDEGWGFYPHVTWTDTTFDNALNLLSRHNYSEEISRVGVLRAYTVRHGPGPMVTEDPALTEALPDPANVTNPWQQNFRVGAFDLPAHRYALAVTDGADYLAITCLDQLLRLGSWRSCVSYRVPNEVAAFFDVTEGYASRIRVAGQRGDLDYQSELTAALGTVNPCYQSWSGVESLADFGDYLAWIIQELRVPIRIASFGPTATEKEALPADVG